MSNASQNDSFLAALRGLRQSRRFLDQSVPAEALASILEVARWTGSAKNTQPWEFIVVDDPETNRALAGYGAFTQFLDNVPLSIVIVLNGTSLRSEAYDEGRVSERIMLAAAHLGLGSGTAWFGTDEARASVRALLGIPEDREPWSAVGIGYTDTSQQQASPSLSGRRPLQDLVSYGQYGKRSS
jgi:nitroreductase